MDKSIVARFMASGVRKVWNNELQIIKKTEAPLYNPRMVIVKHNKKLELMITKRAKAYSSSGLVVYLKIWVFTLS